ncbi:MAG: NAD(P)/FAD-dependent oxidoreductase [Pseudomonadota bacterium]
MTYDFIIVGGSFAGHAAALQLARARKRILLIDAGRPRNRFAHASHGFLGQDGQKPSKIISGAASQLAAYPTVEQREGEVTDAEISGSGFRLSLANGRAESTRRLILATGVRDVLPSLPGLKERWGSSVLHCPYCHGYELDNKPVGVLGESAIALHQATLVPDWGPTTLFTQGTLQLDTEQMAMLQRRNVNVEREPIVELLGNGTDLEAVRLADGRVVALAGLYIAPKTEQASDLAADLGCAFEDGMTGPVIRVDDRQQTSVPGIFAAGDAAHPMANATLAAAAGVMAATGAHQSLIHGT